MADLIKIIAYYEKTTEKEKNLIDSFVEEILYNLRDHQDPYRKEKIASE